MELPFDCRALLLAGAGALAFSSAASAQQGATDPGAATLRPAAADQPAAPAPPGAGVDALNEIVVTGSRVISSNSNSPTPIMGVATDQLRLADPGPIADSINLLPVFSGSRGLTSNPGVGATGVQGGNGVADVLNLRNLGSYRTLVLFDGQRIPPTLFNGVVDVDLIPQELIERVDVVTGGVSAVYGSDAVSGVVNFITNKHFDGVSVHGQYGISQRSDDKAPDLGVAAGTSLFDGRGHIEGSYEYRDDQGIPYRSDRSWDNLWSIEGAGTAASPYHLVSGVHLASYPFGGLITNKGGVLTGKAFASNGVLSAFQAGAPTGSSCCQVGGEGGYNDASMKASLRSQQLFGRMDYDFSDNFHGHLVGAANLKNNEEFGTYTQLTGVTLSANNAFLPATYQQALAAAGQSSFTLNELMSDGPRSQGVIRSQQYYLNAGVDGDVGGYHWAVSYNHGLTDMDTTSGGDLNQQHLAAALDAVVNPATGQTVCAASLTNSAYANCSPLNVFGPTAASSAALNYIFGDVEFRSYTRMDDVDGQISGSPFDTWAGPFNLALSGEWRRMSYNADSSGTPTEYANCTGLTSNCTPTTTLWQQTFPSSGTVSQSVSEGAVEFNAPLIRDLPLVKSLDINGAARFTSYNTSGDYVTWKIGLDWHLTGDLRVRATESRDIRAPTLYDLFQARSVVPGNFSDTLTGTTPYVPSINIGNPNLKAEVGKTTTAGFVWTPQWLPGSSFSLDGYHTTIYNAIVTIQGFNPAYQKVCYDSGGTSPFCALQSRPNGFTDTSTANQVTAWYIVPENLAQVETYGADLEANYNTRILNRRFAARLLASYQPHIIYRQVDAPTIDQGDAAWGQNGLTAAPSLQMTAFLGYELTDELSANLTEHWRNSLKESGVPGQVWVNNHVASFGTTDVTLTYDLEKHLGIGDSQIFLTVQNLLDKNPPPTAYYGSGTSAGYYYEFVDDPVGRYFTLGFRMKL